MRVVPKFNCIAEAFWRPEPHIYWAEGGQASLKVVVFFTDNRVGRIESDGKHLFFEDGNGTYWWYRGYASTQQKQRVRSP